MYGKKAQGISLNTIIIAAIALVVLIVLIAIFSGRIKIFSGSYDKSSQDTQGQVCNAQGGMCEMPPCSSGNAIYPAGGGSWIDCGIGQVCCR